MIEQKNQAELNSYNVAQLQYALADPKCDPIAFLHDLSPSASPAIVPNDQPQQQHQQQLQDIDYDSRRMSSSAPSVADTDSSILSRGEKRSLTPADSPSPKKLRASIDHNVWGDVDPTATSSVVADPDLDGNNKDDQSITTASTAADHASRVQLPSIFTTFEDTYRPDARRASLPTLHSESRLRHSPYPPTSLRQNYAPANQSSLASYTFPPPSHEESAHDKASSRPRLSTDINFNIGSSFDSPYPPSSTLTNGTTPSSSTFPSSNFSSPLSSDYRPQGLSPYPNEQDTWNHSPSGIVRPSSTPGQLSSPPIKYEDSGLRHASFSAPMSQAQMFAGSARISGQPDRRSLSSAGIKTEWSFPNPDNFVLPSGSPSYPSPSTMPSTPSIAVSSPSRSPQSIPSSALVDRPQRKRGKLPKETTDYLKAWLHRHSDHPYPSEEEKKSLCHATGLSMSQVSNWMINARRRILAPAHRASSGPTTTAPFPPTGRTLSSLLDPIGRRASMPADTLQLYHPMTLQSMPSTPSGHHHGGDYLSARSHLLGVPRSSHLSSGPSLEYQHGRGSLGSIYVGPGQQGGGGGGAHFMSSSMPLSAPPSMAQNPYGGAGNQGGAQSQQQGNMYPSFVPSPRQDQQQQQQQQQQSAQQYYGDHGASAPGSGYATPQ